jgi:hypothetical protein
MTTEDPVAERVFVLLDWAAQQLDLLSSAFRGCDDDELEVLRAAQGVVALPAAYAAFMRATGRGGVGSALAELFPGDDVSAESMLPDEDWLGGRGIAEEIVREHGGRLDLGDSLLVIRVHRAEQFEYLDVGEPDGPVRTFGPGSQPAPTFPAFTAWLEYRIGRAIKRRYPLRDAHFHG